MSEEKLAELATRIGSPVWNPSYVPVRIDDSVTHIRAGPWGGPVFTLEEGSNNRSLISLLLEENVTIVDVVEEYPEHERQQVIGLLEQLADHNVIYGADEATEYRPYKPIDARFNRTPEHSLGERQVLIVGDDAIGRQVAEELLETGVEQVDFAPTPNAEQHSMEQLSDAHDSLSVVDERVPDSTIRSADFVVYATDGYHPEYVMAINRTTHESNTPWMPIQRIGFNGIVGPTIYPGTTPCYNCFRDRMLANVEQPRLFGAFERKCANDGAGQPVDRPHLRLLAGYASMDLMNLLAYGQGYTVSRIITTNSLDMSIEFNDVLKSPRCDVCGAASGDRHQRFVSLDDVRSRDGGA